MGVLGCLRRRSPAGLVGALLATALPSVALAQVIEADDTPAPTIDKYAFATASGTEPISQIRGLHAFVDLYTSAQAATNGLSVSNLPGGLDLDTSSDIFWQKGAAFTVVGSISPRVALFARADMSHTNFFEFDDLTYFDIRGSFGAVAALGQQSQAFAVLTCSSERNKSFKEFYRQCGPTTGVNLTVGEPYTGTGLELGLRGSLGLGEAVQYARYKEASFSLGFETGNRLRFRLRPSITGRWYSVPDILSVGRENRRDVLGSINAALFYQGEKLEFGIAADPRVNWSTYEQFRHWDLRAGPYLRMRFGV